MELSRSWGARLVIGTIAGACLLVGSLLFVMRIIPQQQEAAGTAYFKSVGMMH